MPILVTVLFAKNNSKHIQIGVNKNAHLGGKGEGSPGVSFACKVLALP